LYLLLIRASRTTTGILDAKEGKNRKKKGDPFVANTGILSAYIDASMRDWSIHWSYSWEVLKVRDESTSLWATTDYRVRSAGNKIIRPYPRSVKVAM
jgi:hypothetical protein